jgi:hypothetical protein
MLSIGIFHEAIAAVLLLILTFWLQCAGVAAVIELQRRAAARKIYRLGPIRSAALVVRSTVAIIVLHGLVILFWAGFYRARCFPSWELAFYFSASSYATVGYGDVVLPSNWRLLGPLESMTGVLMFGVSVCLLFALVTRLVDRHGETTPQNKRSDDPSLVPARQSQDFLDDVRAQIMPSRNLSAHVFIGFAGLEARLRGHRLRRNLGHPHCLSRTCRRSDHVQIVRKSCRRRTKGEK